MLHGLPVQQFIPFVKIPIARLLIAKGRPVMYMAAQAVQDFIRGFKHLFTEGKVTAVSAIFLQRNDKSQAEARDVDRHPRWGAQL